MLLTSKKTFNLSGLFWKIFFAFWISSVAIFFSTAIVIRMEDPLKKDKERFEQWINTNGQHLLRRLENPKKHQHGRKLAPPFQRPIQIKRGDTTVYERQVKKLSQSKTLEIEATSRSGITYNIKTIPHRGFVSAFETLEKIKWVHLSLIFLTSTLVSLFLSWSIVRPLKALGKYSRSYTSRRSIFPNTAIKHEQSNESSALEIEAPVIERKDEIGDLARDFCSMVAVTEAAINAQQQLLHDVSHELRAPLARLQVAAALFSQPSKGTHSEQKNRQYSHRVQAECERMNQLIQELLDFSRIDRNSAEKTEKINLNQCVEELIQCIQLEEANVSSHEKRQINLIIENTSLNIIGQKFLLERAIGNIIRNACKYSSLEKPIDINIQETDNNIHIIIHDNGPGINMKESEMLLKPFYRSGNQMHTKGFGLGLSIADRAIRCHSGGISLQNRIEGGLSVTITLPKNESKYSTKEMLP